MPLCPGEAWRVIAARQLIKQTPEIVLAQKCETSKTRHVGGERKDRRGWKVRKGRKEEDEGRGGGKRGKGEEESGRNERDEMRGGKKGRKKG